MKNKNTINVLVSYKRLFTLLVGALFMFIQPIALHAANRNNCTECCQQHDETKPIDNASATVPATYKKGMPALFAFIKDNTVYPQSLVKDNIQGAVVVRFVVDTKGKVSDAWIIKGLHPDMDKEAVRVVKMLGKFSPAKLNGKKIPVYFTLPIRFHIRGK